jgi:hypothetical protein
MLGAAPDTDELPFTSADPDPEEGSVEVDDELGADVHADTNSPATAPRAINMRTERRWGRIPGMLLPPGREGRSSRPGPRCLPRATPDRAPVPFVAQESISITSVSQRVPLQLLPINGWITTWRSPCGGRQMVATVRREKKRNPGGHACAQPICWHSRDDHRDGTGVTTNCRMCACSAYVSSARMIGRRLFWAWVKPGRPTNI